MGDKNKKITLKIAIAVHGRFHAFDLAKVLIEKGHRVFIFTNYSKFATRHFGIPSHNVRSFWVHRAVSHLAQFLHEKIKLPYPEALLHKLFGRWTAIKISEGKWDIVHCWSGVSEEVLRVLNNTKTPRILMRGSSHIRTQKCILAEEEKRIGMPVNRPSRWMIAREEREYALADYIRVLSSFAYMSFIKQGVNPKKLLLIPSGVPVEYFRPLPRIIDDRCKRIKHGEPLRILYVGALSFRKGIWDLVSIMNNLKSERFKFCIIGPIASEAKRFLDKHRHLAEFVFKQPQHELPKWYAWADLFVFPTIEEGYAAVLAQAQASCLPILTTTNCQGPDIIVENKTGWILPIRSPQAFIERLLWCDLHREEVANMVKNIYENFNPKNWLDVAGDFTDICVKLGKSRKIAVVVHGRFYAFDIVKELIRQGQDVTLFTTYPVFILNMFGIPKQNVRSLWLYYVMDKAVSHIRRVLKIPNFEAFFHCWFSKWAVQEMKDIHFDIITAFSGVAKEVFEAASKKGIPKILIRGSSHICTQYQLLADEEKRAGVHIEKPSNWIIERENQEYRLADIVQILSTFAEKSFIEQGIPSDRLHILPLGVDLKKFRPARSVIEQRCNRIVANKRLRLLMTGTFSLRKGVIDFCKIASACNQFFKFRFVGHIAKEAKKLFREHKNMIEFIPKQPETKLSKFYNWADMFIFPTIEDGYATVLSQAQASGLPIIATPNCAGPDIIDEGKTGWIIPIRSPALFIERLKWCDSHRKELAQMVRWIYENYKTADWSEITKDYIDFFAKLEKS